MSFLQCRGDIGSFESSCFCALCATVALLLWIHLSIRLCIGKYQLSKSRICRPGPSDAYFSYTEMMKLIFRPRPGTSSGKGDADDENEIVKTWKTRSRRRQAIENGGWWFDVCNFLVIRQVHIAYRTFYVLVHSCSIHMCEILKHVSLHDIRKNMD